jgi:spore coat polysaccharide biosynthesis protein SpsF
MNKKRVNMKIISLIQARMGSERLPGKTLFKIGNKTILEHVIDQAKLINTDGVMLLTSSEKEDDILVKKAINNGISYIRNDVVINRFVEVCKKYKPDWFIRICADSPFFSVELTNNMIEQIKIYNTEYDYMAYPDDIYPSKKI